jgi:hypothetical protein
VESLIQHLPSLGVGGLLFVMWWVERQERLRGLSTVQESLQHTTRALEINDHLLDVIRSNTEALVALREELRAHRETEQEWISRLSRQLEQVALAS